MNVAWIFQLLADLDHHGRRVVAARLVQRSPDEAFRIRQTMSSPGGVRSNSSNPRSHSPSVTPSVHNSSRSPERQ